MGSSWVTFSQLIVQLLEEICVYIFTQVSWCAPGVRMSDTVSSLSIDAQAIIL